MAKKKNTVAFAPYNFVPLNNEVLPAKIMDYLEDAEIEDNKSKQEAYKEYIKDGKKYSGYINLTLENLTPLYIDLEEKMFSINDKICIPGSSIRGCIKNLFKIVTNSAFRVDSDNPDTNNTYLYFRSMASPVTNWRKLYGDQLPTKVVNINGKEWNVSEAKGGFLFLNKDDNRYYIAPAELIYNMDSREAFSEPKIDWEIYGVKANLHSGKMPKKVLYYTIKNPRFDEAILIEDDVMRGYIDDTSRDGLNLLEVKSGENDKNISLHDKFNIKYIVPCFYMSENIKASKRVKHFGSCMYYRVPYQKSIGDQIPIELKEGPIDFTETIFGNKELWASRVSFEDAYIDTDENVLAKKGVSKPLLGPKPTSFQLYLEPKNGNPQHWDSNTTKIRGYKMYWHKTCDWKDGNSKDEDDNVRKILEPVSPGQKFIGKIRFKNLDKVELGALLKTLEIAQEENKAIKLGMGKPLGLGSIKISTKLFVQGDFYYMGLFDEDKFMSEEEADSEKFIADFNNYLEEKLEAASEYKSRIDVLKKMLDASKLEKGAKSWKQKTNYMSYDDEDDKEIYKQKTPLPTADELFEY